MTASTVTPTLSLVITFCGSTLMTRSRMSTLMRFSIIGTRKVSPEPTVVRYLPRRMTRPFSYCDTMRAERATMMRAMNRKIASTKNPRGPKGSSFISSPHQKCDAVHVFDRHFGARLEGAGGAPGRGGAPDLVPGPDLAGPVLGDALHHEGALADHGVGIARDRRVSQVGADPAAPERDVRQAEGDRYDQPDGGVPGDQADHAAGGDGRSDEHQVETGEAAHRPFHQDTQ